jgi:hypothetical protein
MTRIGIDVNGVLRDTIGKFEQLYTKHLVEKDDEEFLNATYQLDLNGNPILIENKVDDFDYKKISDVTTLKLDDHFTFKNEDELFSFIYEEYAMELFGHAPSTEMTTFNILNDFYHENRDNNELLIVSNEIGKSKPSTLFFLSKFGCLLEKVVFFSEITKDDMWKQVDILLTANPSLLLEKHDDKIVIKFETTYNKHIDSEYTILSLSELSQIINKIKENAI